jgi:N-acetylglucosamine kinase-like BadF-type ATPase
MSVFIGVDGGGTKTKAAVVSSSGSVLGWLIFSFTSIKVV